MNYKIISHDYKRVLLVSGTKKTGLDFEVVSKNHISGVCWVQSDIDGYLSTGKQRGSKIQVPASVWQQWVGYRCETLCVRRIFPGTQVPVMIDERFMDVTIPTGTDSKRIICASLDFYNGIIVVRFSTMNQSEARKRRRWILVPNVPSVDIKDKYFLKTKWVETLDSYPTRFRAKVKKHLLSPGQDFMLIPDDKKGGGDA